ncbi:MAG: hypothetical protein Q7J57_11570 [Gemmobacter sp.]|nr:hypothetical protein [Gemmobacter sp.]
MHSTTMTTRLSKASAALAFATTAIFSAASSSADEIRFGNPQSDANPISVGIMSYIDAVNANSDLTLRRYGAALLPQPEIASGLRDGVIGMGLVISAYLPAELSYSNLMAELSMLVTSGTPSDAVPAASAGAMMEYVLFNCPECLQQFADQNMVFLSSGSTNSYDLVCRGVVTSVADLPGLRIRSGAGNFTRWAEAMGATVVTMDSSEVFTAMSQGVLDCNMLSFANMIAFGMEEVAESVLFGVPGGVFSGYSPNVVNLDTWRGLTTEQRAVLLGQSAGLIADITIAQLESHASVMEAVKGSSIVLTQADAATRAATDVFVQKDRQVIIDQFTTMYGMTDVAGRVEVAADLIERWKGLTAGIGDNRDALAALYQREIFSRLDPATYAME